MLRKLLAVAIVAFTFLLASCGEGGSPVGPGPGPGPGPEPTPNPSVSLSGVPVPSNRIEVYLGDTVVCQKLAYTASNLGTHTVDEKRTLQSDTLRCVEGVEGTGGILYHQDQPFTVTNEGVHAIRSCVEVVGTNVSDCRTDDAFVGVPRPIPSGKFVFAVEDATGGFDFFEAESVDGEPAVATQLTLSSGDKRHPMLSKDGTKLLATRRYDGVPGWCTLAVFLSNRDESNSLQLHGIDGLGIPGAPSEACMARTGRNAVFSPDERTILFAGSYNPSGSFGIFTVGVDGSNLTRWFEEATDKAVFHPNGKDIFVSVLRIYESGNRYEVYRFNTATGDTTTIFVDDMIRSGNEIAPNVGNVSGDGEWLVLVPWLTSSMYGRVLLVRTDGSGEERWLDPGVGGIDSAGLCYEDTAVCVVPNTRRSLEAVDLDGTNHRVVMPIPSVGVRIFDLRFVK